jgi:hypothetical protein
MFSLPAENWFGLIVWLLFGIHLFRVWQASQRVGQDARPGKSGQPIRVMAIG